MKKTFKRILSSLMVAVMILTAAPLSGFVGLELPDFGEIFSTKADAATYEVGDIIEFGSYKQSAIKNANGDTIGFHVEPLKWRILKIENGEALLLSNEIVDSKQYNRTSSTVNGYYANNYAHSNIRDWLINDFYNTAFSADEKKIILPTTLDNSACPTDFNASGSYTIYSSEATTDKVFLLSKSEADLYASNYFKTTVTDYAYANGFVPGSGTEPSNHWLLRTAGNNTYQIYTVHIRWGQYKTYFNWYDDTISILHGVRPALKIDIESIDNSNNPDISDDFTESIKIGADRFTFGQDMMGTAGDTLNALLVYTSKENDINDLTITSSNTSVATVGTPEIDKGDYITGENELRANLPITLKSSGTATITVTAPDGTSASILVDVYASMEDSQEVKAYIDEHILFANSNRYTNLTTNASFYNSIWKHEEDSRNFTRYAAWDAIGRVGKFAALDFYGAFQTDNPYDVLLADVFSNYVNNEYGKSAKVFENTAKTILGAPSTFNNVLDVLKTSDAWNSELTETWKDFTDDTQKGWIDGIFLKSETFTLNDYDPAVKDLYNALTKIFKGMTESDFEKIFKGLKNTDTIFDYIGTGADMVFRFFDAYQKYLLAEALCETNEYILSSVESIARQEMSEENGKLLLDALDPYWSACYTDSAFEIVNEFAAEHGFIWSGVDTVYTYLGKGCLKEFVYAAIHSVTGIALDALVLTYNLTYLCLDYLSGLGKLDETHTLMNAAALLEKEYLELVEKEANELKNDSSLENAVMFDTSWGFLQSLESYCYKTLSTYASAMKKEYTTNYVIKNSVSNNLFYTLISTNQLIKDLSACDSGIQSAVYLESEWVNLNCHNGVYSPSNVMAVKCPTDVYVYDSEGNLALSIVGNKVTLCKSNIVAFVDDDEKIFVLPTDQKYDIKITATDDGTMQYSVQCFNNLELLRTVIYDDIELTENKSYTGSIPTDNSAKTDDFNLKSETGTEIKADYDSAAKLQSGICGDDLTWTFNESTGTLTISGTGTMDSYYDETKDRMLTTPWDDYCDKIKTIAIEDGVTSIGDASFAYCQNATQVTISESVTEIGFAAFYHCDSLEEMLIPGSVSTIGDLAFASCSKLKSVKISDGVISIGERAFYYTAIRTVALPKSVAYIGRLVFASEYLTNINVDTQNSVYSSDSYGVLFDKNKTKLILYPMGNTRTKYVIPETVKTIGMFAFACCPELTNITIPGTVTTIEELAFDWCTGLTSVVIEEGVKNIGYSAFAYCESLEYIHIPKSVTSIEYDDIFSIIDETNAYICSDTVDCYAKEYADEFEIEFRVCDGHGIIPEPEENGKLHSVSIDDISMSYKDSATVTPSINADSGVKYTVSYSSSDTDVVSVDANGRLTTNDKGSATITVTVTDEYGNTVTDTCKVEVSYKWWQWIIVIVLFGWIWY